MPEYPHRHISMRVPWHDLGWDGRVCASPRFNDSCLALPNIALHRRDEVEEKVSGCSIQQLDTIEWPCCTSERGAFMAPFEHVRQLNHPYTKTSPQTHGHLATTAFRQPAYSAAAIPFRWMRTENMEDLGKLHRLDVDPGREPDLGFGTSWVQTLENQRALLDGFFRYVLPEKSLCFFYCKRVPFVEDSGRVLVGVGRVKAKGEPEEYRYRAPGLLRCLIWDRTIVHSVRPDEEDGFLLPYAAALARTAQDPDYDPERIAAFAPRDRVMEFSYASEHVTHDGALSALIACGSTLRLAEEDLGTKVAVQLRWLDDRIAELWRMRGPCPGLGAALRAFGVELGVFVSQEIALKCGENEDPWPLVDRIFRDPRKHLSVTAARQIGDTLCRAWRALRPERRALLHLISRFELTPEQATCLYVQVERRDAGIQASEADFLSNPYRFFEDTRLTRDPVSVLTVDHGAFPAEPVRLRHPMPAPSYVDDPLDARRVRALVVDALEDATAEGNTLLPRDEVERRLRERPLDPPCLIQSDIFPAVEPSFNGVIVSSLLGSGEPAYQLDRLATVRNLIQTRIEARILGRRHDVQADWRGLLDARLPKGPTDDMEERARREKSAALAELACSRFALLVGRAGSGKTTLLETLCGIEAIAQGGVLLLAPTGKARVRMQEAPKKLRLEAYTLAQFLSPDRYDCETQRYKLSAQVPTPGARTIIVDEASMLTEEMLGALLDALKTVDRLILIGDHRQLPPIGAGRPFVDLVKRLAPKDSTAFPRIGPSYAELTVTRRQSGEERPDLQLASWFSGEAIEPGEDDIFSALLSDSENPHLRVIRWDTPDELRSVLLDALSRELGLSGHGDVDGFDRSLGAAFKEGYAYFNRGAAALVERWQILSPVRGNPHGVAEMNRLIHRQFRKSMVEFARQKPRKIPKPMGPEEIVYGDKVINVSNHPRRSMYPSGGTGYIANGEIGIAVGQFKTQNITSAPWILKVEFASQPGYEYDFRESDFKEERDPYLQLAYALTVHKAQGSEFDRVLLIVPDHCRLISRELLYTALTRQRSRIVLLCQGDPTALRRFSSASSSETARRFTNLFVPPRPVRINGRFFEENLIHRTGRGELVRSKSELAIAEKLAAAGVAYSYEQELRLGGQSRYPDFTIADDDRGITFYWEHCGMMHDAGYRRRWQDKLAWYRRSGVLPMEEGGGLQGTLIVTSEQPGLDAQALDRIIREIIRK